MKKRSILSALAIALLIFLAGCFANASFDIRTWGDLGRTMVAVEMLGACVLIFAFSESEE